MEPAATKKPYAKAFARIARTEYLKAMVLIVIFILTLFIIHINHTRSPYRYAIRILRRILPTDSPLTPANASCTKGLVNYLMKSSNLL